MCETQEGYRCAIHRESTCFVLPAVFYCILGVHEVRVRGDGVGSCTVSFGKFESVEVNFSEKNNKNVLHSRTFAM